MTKIETNIAMKKYKLQLLLAASIFGTVGIFVKFCSVPSSFISMTRGLIGAAFILIAILLKNKVDKDAIKRNLFKLIMAGIAMGFNWILLFESYKYVTVAVATLCYYLQPVFLTISAPIILKETIDKKKLICIFAALVGMGFVSGVFGIGNKYNPIGILLGVGSAILYTIVVLFNKKLVNIDSKESTMTELLSAGLVMIPYYFLTGGVAETHLNVTTVIMLVIIAFIITGFTYVIYFDSVKNLPAQTVAIFGYLDPVVAIILSSLLLKEPFGINAAIGAILILGSTLISELEIGKGKK